MVRDLVCPLLNPQQCSVCAATITTRGKMWSVSISLEFHGTVYAQRVLEILSTKQQQSMQFGDLDSPYRIDIRLGGDALSAFNQHFISVEVSTVHGEPQKGCSSSVIKLDRK